MPGTAPIAKVSKSADGRASLISAHQNLRVDHSQASVLVSVRNHDGGWNSAAGVE